MIRKFSQFACLLALSLCSFPARAANTNITSQDWQFKTGSAVTIPDEATNAVGTAAATVNVGYLGSGWLETLDGFGTQTGFWDIGFQNPDDPTHDTRGRIELSVPSTPSTTSSSYCDVTLRVTQFVDGFLYKGGLTFSIEGAVSSGRRIVETVSGPFGGKWVEDEFHWHLVPSPQQVSLVITGAVGGTLLDRIRFDTASVVQATTKLVITSVEKRGQNVVLSWVGGLPPYQLYTTTNCLANGAWDQVGSLIWSTNAEISMDGPLKLITVQGSE